MEFPDDENGDVLRQMQEVGFDFTLPHDVEFFAIFATEEMAEAVGNQFVADRAKGEKIITIRTQPAEAGGMELILVKRMLVTYENVTEFENRLAERVSHHGGYLDGWGAMQE